MVPKLYSMEYLVLEEILSYIEECKLGNVSLIRQHLNDYFDDDYFDGAFIDLYLTDDYDRYPAINILCRTLRDLTKYHTINTVTVQV